MQNTKQFQLRCRCKMAIPIRRNISEGFQTGKSIALIRAKFDVSLENRQRFNSNVCLPEFRSAQKCPKSSALSAESTLKEVQKLLHK